MQKISTTEELRTAIALLSIKQAEEGVLLKKQLKLTYENLRPANLIKNTLQELTSPDMNGGIVNNLLGLTAGFLSKKITVGNSHNPFKQILGSFLQAGVSNIVSKNGDGIKSTVMGLINNFLQKNTKSH